MGPIGYWKYGSEYEFVKFLIPLVILDLVLRGFALWKSARLNQNIWFIALLVINSLGILPLIYLVLNRVQKEPPKKLHKSK